MSRKKVLVYKKTLETNVISASVFGLITAFRELQNLTVSSYSSVIRKNYALDAIFNELIQRGYNPEVFQNLPSSANYDYEPIMKFVKEIKYSNKQIVKYPLSELFLEGKRELKLMDLFLKYQLKTESISSETLQKERDESLLAQKEEGDRHQQFREWASHRRPCKAVWKIEKIEPSTGNRPVFSGSFEWKFGS